MSPCQGEGRGFDSRLALAEISKKPMEGFFFFMAKGNAVEYTEKWNAFYQNISFMI